MSDLIKVPYTELFQRAARIRQEAETIRAEIDTLQQTVESVQWMGKRAERFFTLWNGLRPRARGVDVPVSFSLGEESGIVRIPADSTRPAAGTQVTSVDSTSAAPLAVSACTE